VDGKRLESRHYDLVGGSYGSYRYNKAIVDKLKRQPLVQCYYDPANPSFAVLERDIRWNRLLLLLPAILMFFSLAGMFYLRRFTIAITAAAQKRGQEGFSDVVDKNTARQAFSNKPFLTPFASPFASSGPVTLSPKATPWNNFFGFLVATVLVVGASVFLIHESFGFPFALIIAVPFSFMGVLFVFISAMTFLACFNPKVELTISQDRLVLGTPAELRWSVSDRADRFSRFTITLEGREEVTQTRNETTTTSREVFAKYPVVQTTRIAEMIAGREPIGIPIGNMHSFAFGNGKIVWSIKLRGDIPRWPAVQEEYEITVEPPGR
jgi:hypothetical protein